MRRLRVAIDEIKNLNLADTIKDAFGRNYTTVSNEALSQFVTNHKKSLNNVPVDIEMFEHYKSAYNQLLDAFALFFTQLPADFLDAALEKSDSIIENGTLKNVEFSDEELDSLFDRK